MYVGMLVRSLDSPTGANQLAIFIVEALKTIWDKEGRLQLSFVMRKIILASFRRVIQEVCIVLIFLVQRLQDQQTVSSTIIPYDAYELFCSTLDDPATAEGWFIGIFPEESLKATGRLLGIATLIARLVQPGIIPASDFFSVARELMDAPTAVTKRYTHNRPADLGHLTAVTHMISIAGNKIMDDNAGYARRRFRMSLSSQRLIYGKDEIAFHYERESLEVSILKPVRVINSPLFCSCFNASCDDTRKNMRSDRPTHGEDVTKSCSQTVSMYHDDHLVAPEIISLPHDVRDRRRSERVSEISESRPRETRMK